MSTCESSSEGVDQWIHDGGWVIILLGMIQCIWGLARVCDHYFCSSLRVVCDVWKIPDNVVGATVMAIGTSAADLFISMISLFHSKSTLGLGTIIGSLIFNHLIVTFGCIVSSKTGKLVLDKYIFMREMLAYFISMVFLAIVLRNSSPEHDQWLNCIPVRWFDGLILLCIYFLYAIIVVNFENILEQLGIHRDMNNLLSNCESGELKFDETKLCSAQEVNSNTEMVSVRHDIGNATEFENGSEIYDKSNKVRENDTVNVFSVGSASDDKKLSDADSFSLQAYQRAGRVDLVISKLERAMHYYTYPLHICITYSIPDVTLESYRNYYAVSIFLSLIWLGVLAQLMLNCLEILGELLGMVNTAR